MYLSRDTRALLMVWSAMFAVLVGMVIAIVLVNAQTRAIEREMRASQARILKLQKLIQSNCESSGGKIEQ